ncbi:MFS transporter [Streptomyces sp. A7024]|uniref:MFS transporter n=1 Tax=Streptomyces coryli TaxID=1128680 RepID=A0A6G4U1Q3_9ACTN|nr:MFS transporter [Streptomyces coryli]NGN66013.1 MFS transporter [Streptomyces coryli]
MYLSHTRAADTTRAATPAGPAGRVPPTVVALGMVSLVTDASAEMVTAVLPMYLMYGLGVGYLQLGALDGLYTGATALFRLGGGYAADRFRRRKAVAVVGYGLSALTRLGFPAVGAGTTGIGLLLAADRTGKGLRTAPRDALITLATPADRLGRAFGVHRTLDTCGALLGPLLAFGLLLLLPSDYDAVFVVSFLIAAVGVLVLVFFVRERPRGEAGDSGGGRVTLRTCLRAVAGADTRRVVAAAALLGVVTVGDMFLYVALQRRMELPEEFLPLLPLGTAVVFMAAALPVGRAADRAGRWRLFLGGHLLLLLGYVCLALAPAGWTAAAVVLVLHGLFYAATDGVLMAHVAPAIPARARTTGLAVVQTAQALARAGGALIFGVAAAALGLGLTFTAAAVALAGVLGAAALLHRPGAGR